MKEKYSNLDIDAILKEKYNQVAIPEHLFDIDYNEFKSEAFWLKFTFIVFIISFMATIFLIIAQITLL